MRIPSLTDLVSDTAGQRESNWWANRPGIGSAITGAGGNLLAQGETVISSSPDGFFWSEWDSVTGASSDDEWLRFGRRWITVTANLRLAVIDEDATFEGVVWRALIEHDGPTSTIPTASHPQAPGESGESFFTITAVLPQVSELRVGMWITGGAFTDLGPSGLTLFAFASGA